MLNGLFPIKRLQDSDDLKDHFYRIMVHHILKKAPSLEMEWSMLTKKIDPEVYYSESFFFDVADTIKTFMEMRTGKPVKFSSTLASKVSLLKRIIKNIDPIGIDERWVYHLKTTRKTKISFIEELEDKEDRPRSLIF
mmetsp:Transcript_17216/g.15096  ORF Transcript_17216/g.15096 Transcript_17216/m.15096 type:complete len:137 (+) Transcript_17216:681-1091(+)